METIIVGLYRDYYIRANCHRAPKMGKGVLGTPCLGLGSSRLIQGFRVVQAALFMFGGNSRLGGWGMLFSQTMVERICRACAEFEPRKQTAGAAFLDFQIRANFLGVTIIRGG